MYDRLQKVASDLFMTKYQGWKAYYRFKHNDQNNFRLTNWNCVHLNTNNYEL